tara:strand:+ start:20064 stop:20411 length:348 start_codon:yes stop_codon:yes gene_type:complete
MPVLNSIKRRLVEHLATLVNELHLGSDGTEATANDGGVRSLGSITPNVRIIDDSSIQIDGRFDATHIFNSSVQEVYLQYKDPTTNEFVPIYRAAIEPFTKNAGSEIAFSFILELD